VWQSHVSNHWPARPYDLCSCLVLFFLQQKQNVQHIQAECTAHAQRHSTVAERHCSCHPTHREVSQAHGTC
jgi:hypothetical protein